MAWRVADSLEVLLAEVDHRWPDRDRSSDGSIGDASHQARPSSHNPTVIDDNGIGVVRARDFTNKGIDVEWFVDHIRALGKAGDPRLAGGYVISKRRIASERKNWEWRPYTGPNPHDKHTHLSTSDDQANFDRIEPWGVFPLAPAQGEGFLQALTPEEQKDAYRILQKLEKDYLLTGKSVRQAIVHTESLVEDIASGKRPANGT